MRLKRKSVPASRYWPLKLVLLFFMLMALLVWLGQFPLWLAGVYAVLSLLTFAVYAWDKQQAKNAGQRTPESTLQLLSLLGGWPGGWLAQQHLRHKSQKKPFLRVFWFAVTVNLGVLLYLARVFWS